MEPMVLSWVEEEQLGGVEVGLQGQRLTIILMFSLRCSNAFFECLLFGIWGPKGSRLSGVGR